ncbi:hypothetical protein B0T13DRAFT_67181 [Neurospora crassa]|nr:hypothetical protein B0T13DRAFT_67181 [Neurospora crassa]
MPGGVCAVLDYEVELMADYVSEMATRIVMPQNAVNTAFRKFVSQILTSTRLPSTTILLGMNYLAKRINMMKANGQTTHSEGQIWRMLTISLLLGSKFLDDNTFQNKSWSEVSGIPVKELNTLEYEWLGVIGWRLYVNLDESEDYNAWLANWKEWLEAKKLQQAQANRERLASLVPPIKTDISRSRFSSAWEQKQIAEYERLSSIKRSQTTHVAYPRHEQSVWGHWSQQQAPLTPPDSGYGTPEYVNSATSVNSHYNEWFDSAVRDHCQASRQYQQPASYNSFYRGLSNRHQNGTSGYWNYTHNVWEHSLSGDCNCATCAATDNSPPYFMGHTYGQPVVG